MRSLKPSKKVHGTLFSLSVALKDGSNPRFSCVVSKKVAPKAVTRNLIKRRCRAATRGHAVSLPGGAYIFTAKRAAAGALYREIANDVVEMLTRVA